MFLEQYNFSINNTHLKEYIDKHINSSDSLLISKICDTTKKPLLVIVNNGYDATRIANEVLIFNKNLHLAIFHDTETLPYERISPSKQITAERFKVLWQLKQKTLDLVIIQANTLQNILCPLEYLYSRVLILSVNNKLSIAALRTSLVGSDYLLVDKVLEAGEFAIRGGIIDIIPMGYNKLLRIELFDDEIESIKHIDIKTNHTIENLTKIEIIPAKEFPLDKENIKIFAQNFKKYFPQEKFSFLHKEIQNEILPPNCEFLLPLFFNQTASIFDYIDNNWQIAYFSDLNFHLNNNWQDINKRYNLYNYQYPCLKPNDIFLTSEIIFFKMKNFKRYEIKVDGMLDANLQMLPDLTMDHKINPYTKLDKFIKTFKGQIFLFLNNLGKVEIIKNTLIKNNIVIDNNKFSILQANLYSGFICHQYAFITENDLYEHEIKTVPIKTRVSYKSRYPEFKQDLIIEDLSEIEIGDLVIHVDYGIGKYLGLTTQSIDNIKYDMLTLEYQNSSKLFIPVDKLNQVSRYSNFAKETIELDTLGSNRWKKVKHKTQSKINDVAAHLLELYANREIQSGFKFTLPDEYTQFANEFKYEPTVDQQKCFDEIIQDMTATKPMDRLICGDVGFGKTEVAIRAAFICAMNNKQVAVLSPTTLLTEQHFQSFLDRFANYPITIAKISRFQSRKEIQDTLSLASSGKIDILIGTHKLLQDDIKFANLGLIIIDEEHRFGVKQKEKLKQLRNNVDILALTATPIPRTLSMALDGIRDFSIIATAPQKRLAVNTIIINENYEIIKEAIQRELRRGGQLFILYNDVATIHKMYEKIISLMPDTNIAIAHGQMKESQLEITIRDFIQQRYNILLCSTIIENGIDIANVNTIIIYNAHKFGLAQLHQLRGRVGRSHHQAYCYLITPENLNKDAIKRIEAITATSDLGAGFNLAMYDLEIRGAGEFLGEKQSGDIKEVGLSLYTEMLKKAISKLKVNNKLSSNENYLLDNTTEINLNISAIIPDNYCYDVHKRLVYYKQLSYATTTTEIDNIYMEIINKYGIAPSEVKNLIQSHYLRIKANKLGIKNFDFNNKRLQINFVDNPNVDPQKLIALIHSLKTCKFNNNQLIWNIIINGVDERLSKAHNILDTLSNSF